MQHGSQEARVYGRPILSRYTYISPRVLILQALWLVPVSQCD